MAVTYGFYNSLNKDRVYNAEQISSIFDGVITDGVFASIGDMLIPIPGNGMQVIVKTGKCWFNSTWTLNDAPLPLDLDEPDVGLTRIDAIIIEVDASVSKRSNSIKIVKGTPSANPEKPNLINSEILHQYALGYVTITPNTTSITADKIENNVGNSSCPFITSILQQTNIEELFNQWDFEFHTWFSNIKMQLSGDVAANLQKQVDDLKAFDATVLTPYTKTLMGLPENATPDDAFLAIYIGTGKSLVKVTLKGVDGLPAVGYSIGGLSPLLNRPIVTDENGRASGIASSNSPTLTVTSKYIDIPSISKKITTTGTITNVNLQFEKSEGKIYTYRASQSNIIFSPYVKNLDISAVGGGGGGAGPVGDGDIMPGGNGGNGGQIVNKFGYPYTGEKISITIGAGGAGSVGVGSSSYYPIVGNSAASGGTTEVTIGNTKVVSAIGGSGASGSTANKNSNNYPKSYLKCYGGSLGPNGSHGGSIGRSYVDNDLKIGEDSDDDPVYGASNWGVGSGKTDGAANPVIPLNDHAYSSYGHGGGAGASFIKYRTDYQQSQLSYEYSQPTLGADNTKGGAIRGADSLSNPISGEPGIPTSPGSGGNGSSAVFGSNAKKHSGGSGVAGVVLIKLHY